MSLGYWAIAIAVMCPVLRAIAYTLGYEYGNPYTWLVADGLACGALLSILVRGFLADRKKLQRFSVTCVAGAALLFALGAPFGILLSGSFLGGSLRETLLNVLFTGTLGIALLVGTSRWKWLAHRPVLQFFGEISYGLYLIHTLVFDVGDHFIGRYLPRIAAESGDHFGLVILRFVFGAAVATFIAFLSRRYFEAPFLRMKDRWTGSQKSAQVVVPAS